MEPEKIIFTDIINEDTEFFPLLSPEDEERMNLEDVPKVLPILPLRNTVLFPGVLIPITVGRDKSIKLIRDTYKKERVIGVVAQKDADVEDPEPGDLYATGTVAYIVKTLQMPDGSTTVILQGKKRFQLVDMVQTEPYMIANVKQYDQESVFEDNDEFKALIGSLKDISLQIIKKSPEMPSDAAFAIKNIESPTFLVNFVSSNLKVDNAEKQKLLEINNLKKRADFVLKKLSKELQMIELKNQIQSKVQVDIDKQQRDYFLNQQLKTIQEELGGLPGETDIKELKVKAAKKRWSKDIKNIFNKEVSKLQRMNPQAADYSIQMNYLEFLVELPWGEYTSDSFDLKRAAKILDDDHYGLEKIKERIIEYLAVIKLKNDLKSPILCLVGPPGVGKTSLGKSIARAIGRKYIRMSLGGIRDEAEIRGHRKTYIGALPGRILQSIKKAKSSNPVFVLDEVDKISTNTFSGDPASALLEVLDPEQNTAFYDNYLETEYDLSRVMFIATANTLSTVHPALRDRMEIINLSGYLMEEKVEIAKRHLIPKQLLEHGLKAAQLKFPKATLKSIIENYTRESGVRALEKRIAKVARIRAKQIVMQEEDIDAAIDKNELEKILGIPVYKKEQRLINPTFGVVTGLAWTTSGGEILFVEASVSKGKGVLTLTGNLGDVMKESATLALEYIRSHAEMLGLSEITFTDKNVHIHVPEGATPKDGPSAGITMFASLVSVFTKRVVKTNVAMTGEITLRGKVLPVGGIKEKILAAKRAKITDIIISEYNRKDIEDIDEKYVKGVTFHYIDSMIDVVDIALSPAQKNNTTKADQHEDL